MKTIEQMAVDAGFDRQGAHATHGVIHWTGIYANIDGRDDITEQLTRFAALVAERCAEVADEHSAVDRRFDRLGEGSRVAGWEIGNAIRTEFPKP